MAVGIIAAAYEMKMTGCIRRLRTHAAFWRYLCWKMGREERIALSSNQANVGYLLPQLGA